jgi:NAD(P)-dependent dehydrogenase (short-subunit alcohol dehydrogenase family)
VAGYGIRVTLVEPGAYATDWGRSSAVHSRPLAAYDEVRARADQLRASYPYGDPDASAEAILAVVDAEEPPSRILLGAPPLQLIRAA